MWEDSDACLIDNAENVQLRSFDTKVHLKVVWDVVIYI